VALKVDVVVNARRARMAEAEVVIGAAGAAEKRVRVVEGRRRKEARSLEAIVAVFLVLLVRLLAAHDEMRRGGDRLMLSDLGSSTAAHFKMVRAFGGSLAPCQRESSVQIQVSYCTRMQQAVVSSALMYYKTCQCR
jgi:hypothetical protein